MTGDKQQHPLVGELTLPPGLDGIGGRVIELYSRPTKAKTFWIVGARNLKHPLRLHNYDEAVRMADEIGAQVYVPLQGNLLMIIYHGNVPGVLFN